MLIFKIRTKIQKNLIAWLATKDTTGHCLKKDALKVVLHFVKFMCKIRINVWVVWINIICKLIRKGKKYALPMLYNLVAQFTVIVIKINVLLVKKDILCFLKQHNASQLNSKAVLSTLANHNAQNVKLDMIWQTDSVIS